jgi:hypothetical protein
VQKRRDRSLEYYARKKAQRASQSVWASTILDCP